VSAKTSIAWSDATWNPTVGCSRVSAGCEHCYAERQAHRFHGIEGHALADLTESGKHGPRWNGTVRLNPNALELPLRWKKPRRIFVNSMSDLFHEQLSDEQIDQVFAVMALRPQHTYLVLTKRPERMRAYMTGDRSDIIDLVFDAVGVERGDIAARVAVENLESSWPLSNVWLGVSCEDQKTADERIPLLLQTPAAKRFVSYEPALGPVDFAPWLKRTTTYHFRADVAGMLRRRLFDCLIDDAGREMLRKAAEFELNALLARGVKFIAASNCDDFDPENGCRGHANARVDWIICGGESGPGARPCDISWIRSTVEECKAAGVKVLVKQLGARPFFRVNGDESPTEIAAAWHLVGVPEDRVLWDDAAECWLPQLSSRKGDDIDEFPEDLRVREFPS